MGASGIIQGLMRLAAAGLLLCACGAAQVLVDGQANETVTITSNPRFANASVTSSSPTAFTFTVNETDVPTLNWLLACVGQSCATQSPQTPGNGTTNTTLSLQIINDLAGSLTAPPYHADVTITPSSGPSSVIHVIFAPGQSGTSSTPVTPTTLLVSVVSGGAATNSLTLTNNSGGAVSLSANASTNDGNNWLAVGTPNPVTVSAGGVSQISVTTTAGVLPNGTYNGTVTINASPGAPVTVPVTFTIGATGLTLSTNNLGLVYASGVSQTQTVTVAGVARYNAAATTASGGNWLQLSTATPSQTGTVISNIPSTTQLVVFVGQAAASVLDP